MDLYGAKRSLFTGKVEAYLRAKGIPYNFKVATLRDIKLFKQKTGVVQIPQIQFDDGSWITDSTSIIRYFEEQQPQPAIYCQEPYVQFIALLLEEYFDEWFWDIGIYMRFRDRHSGKFVARNLVGEFGTGLAIPKALLTHLFLLNRKFYLRAMGVLPSAGELLFKRFLTWIADLEEVFKQQKFLLGCRPTAADFGLFAPMFRHINCDPYSADLLREHAPAVNEWCARMWNLTPASFVDEPETNQLPAGISRFLKGFDQQYLPYLKANIEAYKEGAQKFEFIDQGVKRKTTTSLYRIWSFQELQKRYKELPDEAQQLLSQHQELKESISMLKQALPVTLPEFPTMPVRESESVYNRDMKKI